MFEMIHDIVFHGNGGFDWHTIYNMPIWLRKFTYNKLLRHYKDKNESQNSTVQTGKGKTRSINFEAPPSDIRPGERV
jgi:hypothetical protein